jgi:cytidyltransferase-like protein
MKNIVLITGGFDPIHSGHVDYIAEAKKLGDILVVGINSDEWLCRKKGNFFLPSTERRVIIAGMKGVDYVVLFNDDDGSAKDAIRITRRIFPEDRIIFANGGDRTSENIPEMKFEDENLSFVFGIGGSNKKNSSSWILDSWNKKMMLERTNS